MKPLEHQDAKPPSTIRDRHRERIAVIATCLFCAAGWGFYLALPVLLSATANHFHYSAQQIGWLGSFELSGVLLGGLIATATIERCGRQRLASCGLVMVALSLLAVWHVESFSAVAAARLVGGAGAGITYSTCLACLALTSNPARSFGMLSATMVLAGALQLATFPMIELRYGLHGVLLVLAAECAIAFVLLRHLPTRPPQQVRRQTSTGARPGIAAAGLVFVCATVLFHVAPAAFWAYCARLASDNRLDSELTGNVLMIGNLASAATCLVAWRISRALGERRALLYTGTALAVVLLSWAAPMFGAGGYALRATAFFITWGIASVFQQSDARTFDTTGRMMAVIPVAQNSGLAIGPLAGATILGWGYSVTHMLAIAAVSLLASLALYLFVDRLKKRSLPAYALHEHC